MRTTLPRTSQPRREASLLPAPTAPALEPRSSPSTPSPKARSFAWWASEDDAGQRTAQLTRSLLLQPDWWETTGYVSTAVRSHRHPEHHAVLQTGVSVKRHPSSYFPCSPSVTRFGAGPAPCGTARLAFSAFRKSFRRGPQERGKKRFSNLPKMRRLALRS